MISAEFKTLSEEEKKQYEDMAAKDKERYKEEMSNYDAPEEDSDATPDPKKKKKKAKKDPNAPKRGQTSYMFFAAAMRTKFKEENPELSFADLVSCNSGSGLHT